MESGSDIDYSYEDMEEPMSAQKNVKNKKGRRNQSLRKKGMLSVLVQPTKGVTHGLKVGGGERNCCHLSWTGRQRGRRTHELGRGEGGGKLEPMLSPSSQNGSHWQQHYR